MAEKFEETGTGSDDLTLGRQSTAQEVTEENITIRVAQLGRDIIEVTGPKDMTVGQALDKAGMGVTKGLDLRVNNSSCNLDRKLADGEIVMLVPKIRGGVVEEVAIVISDDSHRILDTLWFSKTE